MGGTLKSAVLASITTEPKIPKRYLEVQGILHGHVCATVVQLDIFTHKFLTCCLLLGSN